MGIGWKCKENVTGQFEGLSSSRFTFKKVIPTRYLLEAQLEGHQTNCDTWFVGYWATSCSLSLQLTDARKSKLALTSYASRIRKFDL